ncbi:MAG: hypothetical protein ACK2TX_12455, partial [Anaerolineales bacterium]
SVRINHSSHAITPTAAVLSTLSLFGLRRLPASQAQRWQSIAGKVDPQPIYRLLWRPLRGFARFARTIGAIFEGEGALIWMFVVVLFLVLALGAG